MLQCWPTDLERISFEAVGSEIWKLSIESASCWFIIEWFLGNEGPELFWLMFLWLFICLVIIASWCRVGLTKLS